MRTVVINEARFSTADDLYAYLARLLDFPDYYGANLDALNDCLGDLDEHARIYLIRLADFERDGEAWFDRFCTVISRAAEDNENLQVVVARIISETE